MILLLMINRFLMMMSIINKLFTYESRTKYVANYLAVQGSSLIGDSFNYSGNGKPRIGLLLQQIMSS